MPHASHGPSVSTPWACAAGWRHGSGIGWPTRLPTGLCRCQLLRNDALGVHWYRAVPGRSTFDHDLHTANEAPRRSPIPDVRHQCNRLACLRMCEPRPLDLQPADGSIIRHRDILVNLAGDLHQASNHRSVYLCYLRSSPPPDLAAFDIPDFTTPTGGRDVSTVPGQALHLFNSPFVIAQAECFVRNVMSAASDDQTRVRFAFRRALNRDPSQEELDEAIELLRLTKSDLDSEDKPWTSLCQALLVTNEFRYVD